MATLTIQQANDAGVIIGLRSADSNNPVRPRLDIDVYLSTDPDGFNLFLLAMNRIQTDPNTADKMDWFQVSGIHGLPTTPWDGIRRPNSSERVGYCIHGLLPFSNWHRPYIAQLEQSLYNEMILIANEFPANERPKYKAAASRFRFPYWDWFRPRGNTISFPGVVQEGNTTRFPYNFKLPQIMTVPEVMVRIPSDSSRLRLIANPLYSYYFPQSRGLTTQEWDIASAGGRVPFSTARTCRRPMAPRYDRSNDAGVDTVINTDRESNVITLFNLLNLPAYKDWRAFSNHSSVEGLTRGSIEGLHDDYHVYLGGFGGHMQSPATAGFDPAFWLHHCNVDRVLALWQAVNPDAWFPTNPPRGQGPDDPLVPFRRRPGNVASSFWTSNQCRDTSALGYTYPDLLTKQTPTQVLSTFNRRYGWSIQSLVSTTGFPSTPTSDMLPIDISRSQFVQYPRFVAGSPFDIQGVDTYDPEEPTIAHNPDTAQQLLGSDQSVSPPSDGHKAARQYYLDTEAPRTLFNGPFTVYFFLHDPTSTDTPPNLNDARSFATDPTLAATSNFFIAQKEICDNCMQQAEDGGMLYNTAAITPKLMDYIRIGRLESLAPEHVKPFLAKGLRWRVVWTHNPEPIRGPNGLPVLGNTGVVGPYPVIVNPLPDALKVHLNTHLMYIELDTYAISYGAPEDLDAVLEGIVNGGLELPATEAAEEAGTRS